MRTAHHPPSVLPVVGPFSWGLEVAPGGRWLMVSGQVGADAQGQVPEGLMPQARLVWANLDAVLRSAGMTARDIVRTGIYLAPQVAFTAHERSEFNALRSAYLGEPAPASTLVFVHRLMDPRWLVEIDAIAVAPAGR
jgi:2-iminobutanoate/2-iminopropanoate deaminase